MCDRLASYGTYHANTGIYSIISPLSSFFDRLVETLPVILHLLASGMESEEAKWLKNQYKEAATDGLAQKWRLAWSPKGQSG